MQQNRAALVNLYSSLRIVENLIEKEELSTDETGLLLRVVTDCSRALMLLDQYDHDSLRIQGTKKASSFVLTYDFYKGAIKTLANQYRKDGLSSVLFSNETFEAKDLYASVEKKAANLLYFVVKDHSFTDGNKRIAAFIFLIFLEKNQCLYKRDGSRRLADNGLVALTLMIAESKPEEKDTMVRLVVNLINDEN